MQLDTKKRGRLFQEAAGSRRALVVHHELDDLAGFPVDLDGLRVLTANVEDRSRLGNERVGTHGVATDLGHDAVGDVLEFQRNASIAGTDDMGQIPSANLRKPQELLYQGICRLLHEEPGRHQRGVDFVVHQERSLGRSGTQVQPKHRPWIRVRPCPLANEVRDVQDEATCK